MTTLLRVMVPTATAVGTITLWWAPRLSLLQALAALLLSVAAVVAHRARATTRWLGLGQSLMGTIQAFSWVVAGPWASLIACVEPLLPANRSGGRVRLFNLSSLIIMSCAGWWGFHLSGGHVFSAVEAPLEGLALPVAVGASAQVLANMLLTLPGLAILRGHRFRALVADALRVLRAGWLSQVVGGVLVALLLWAVEPHGVGLLLAAVPLMVHMAVLSTVQAAEQGQAQALRVVTRTAHTREPYVEHHGARVAEYAKDLGRQLRLGPFEMESLDLAARLHDIGYVAPAGDPTEMRRHHPAQGARMLQGMPFGDAAATLIRRSHEPLHPGDSTSRARLPLSVLQVADALDALANSRPGATIEELVEVLAAYPECYDRRVVEAALLARPVLRPAQVDPADRPAWWVHDLPTERGVTP